VWYKFCLDKITDPLDKQNSEEPTLEENISEEREQHPDLPAELLRQYQYSRDPNRYFSNGQGGTYRMQEGRDQVWNSSPDNFINTTDWNS
jgi:hypothetical protein